MAQDGSGFTAQERAAMKQRAEELRASKNVKGAAKKEKELSACLAAIEEMTGLDRTISERFHIVVTEEAPSLDPKTWYGSPAYAREGKIVTFMQPSSKFGIRYATVGFNEDARLDDGAIWATSFAVTDWNDEVEKELRAQVRKADRPAAE